MFDRVNKGLFWDRAWSLVSGCSHASPGCVRCWLAAESHMRAAQNNPKIKARYSGLVEALPCYPPKFNGTVRCNEDVLDLPLRTRKPTAWAIWSDLFHPKVPPRFLAEALNVMASWQLVCRKRDSEHEHDEETCFQDPGHIFMALTKRPERIGRAIVEAVEWSGEYMPGDWALPIYCGATDAPLPNLWLGTTVCNRAELGKIDELRKVPAALRFLSLEPLLEDLGPLNLDGISWVILGGESGHGARPLDPAWVRSVRDQCVASGVKFFFKSWGSNLALCFRERHERYVRMIDDKNWLQVPEVKRNG